MSSVAIQKVTAVLPPGHARSQGFVHTRCVLATKDVLGIGEQAEAIFKCAIVILFTGTTDKVMAGAVCEERPRKPMVHIPKKPVAASTLEYPGGVGVQRGGGAIFRRDGDVIADLLRPTRQPERVELLASNSSR